MYGGGCTTIAGGAVGACSLATTGTSAMLLALLGLVMIIVGLLLMRAVMVRPGRL